MDRVFLPQLLTRGFELDLGGLGHTLLTAFAVRRERRALRELDAHLLRDIGLDEPAAAREAERAPWDLPDGR